MYPEVSLPASRARQAHGPTSETATPSPFRVVEHTVPCSYIREYPRATASAQDENLHMCVKQYIPLNNPHPKPGDLTIIGAHGSGLPKELYEPLWEDLLSQCEAQGVQIRSIWIADVCHQGASGVRNEDKLGNDPSWFDHCRDLLLLVNTFREDMPRPIMGVGHSMGAAQLILLSLMHPRLFYSMVMLEPIMDKCTNTCQGPTLTKLSTFRRDVWNSRAEAEAAARKSYKAWDKRVLDRWMKYGFRELSTLANNGASAPVTLTTTKHQEVFSYLRPHFNALAQGEPVVVETASANAVTAKSPHIVQVDRLLYPDVVGPPGAVTPFYRAEPIIAHMALPHVRPSILYVFGQRSPVSTPELRGEKMSRTGSSVGGSGGATEARVKEVLIPKAGHLVPMEAASQCASATAEWLASESMRFKEDETRIAKGWAEKSLREKSTVSREWTTKIKSLL